MFVGVTINYKNYCSKAFGKQSNGHVTIVLNLDCCN